jgi:hypothetical protein
MVGKNADWHPTKGLNHVIAVPPAMRPRVIGGQFAAFGIRVTGGIQSVASPSLTVVGFTPDFRLPIGASTKGMAVSSSSRDHAHLTMIHGNTRGPEEKRKRVAELFADAKVSRSDSHERG